MAQTAEPHILTQDIDFVGTAEEAYEELVSGVPEAWPYPAVIRPNMPNTQIGKMDATLYARLSYQEVNAEHDPNVVCAVPYSTVVTGTEVTREVTLVVPYSAADYQGIDLTQRTLDLADLLAPLHVKDQTPAGFLPVSVSVTGGPRVIEKLGARHSVLTVSVVLAQESTPSAGWVFSRPES